MCFTRLVSGARRRDGVVLYLGVSLLMQYRPHRRSIRSALGMLDFDVGISSAGVQVRDLEKKYAVTTAVLEEEDGVASVKGVALLCIEVANWRSKQKLIRLRFRVSTSFACCVGAPEVEVRKDT